MKGRKIIQIDGSQRSGSGTILRDAAVFCILSRKALKMNNIRARRPKPGLRHQHLAFLNAASEICNGKLEGGSIGSSTIELIPGKNIKAGKFTFDIGSAGSAVMLALNLVPLGLYAQSPSVYRIIGGLFQDFAPSAFHFQYVLVPLIRKMGADIRVEIIRPGYVPKGRGVIEIRISPLTKKMNPIMLTDQGQTFKVEGFALSSHLDKRKVSERMADECRKCLETWGLTANIRILNDSNEAPVFEKAAVQAGAALAAWAETDTGCIIGADMAGALRRSAEFIGKHVAGNLMEDIQSSACSDRFLSDQIIPFAALAEGRSRIRIPKMTDHVESRLWLAKTILGAELNIDGNLVQIDGIGHL
ncbi:MAG: RNA 3'-terminal phosphate cyclase [Desulfobacterales bacterium]